MCSIHQHSNNSTSSPARNFTQCRCETNKTTKTQRWKEGEQVKQSNEKSNCNNQHHTIQTDRQRERGMEQEGTSDVAFHQQANRQGSAHPQRTLALLTLVAASFQLLEENKGKYFAFSSSFLLSFLLLFFVLYYFLFGSK